MLCRVSQNEQYEQVFLKSGTIFYWGEDMWDNSLWEQENQDLLKEWYQEKVSGKEPDLRVRKIHCEGCGAVFYTQVHSKRYCNGWCAKLGYWKHQRQKRLADRTDRVCAVCGKKFIPARSDALYCSNACRQSAYRQRVTDKSCVQSEQMI